MQVAPVTELPASSYACAVYEVIAAPFDAGAVHETVTFPVPERTVNPVGALGTPAGVKESDSADSLESPTPLVVVAVNVYEDPFVSPETLHEVAGGVMEQFLPGIAVPVES